MNEQTVQDLVLGRLQGEALDGVERHVSECSSCAALIAAAGRQTGSRGPSAAAPPGTRGLVSKPSINVGTVVGRFVIVEFLGAGGMGEVYAAYDPSLERNVAVKFLRPELLAGGKQEVAAERLRREARLVAKLSHPNVVTVYEIDLYEGRLFIAMEFVDGQSVAEWSKAAPQPVSEVIRVFLAAGAGLAAAHAAGVVHRDFKPHNVMIAKGGGVRVMDFGLAHLDTDVGQPANGAPAPAEHAQPSTAESSAEREARLTRTGTLLGTPAYMAPEQLLGKKATARADQYSFCVALHEALFGRRPSATGESAPAGRSVQSWIRNVLKRGLAADPAHRYASMDDLLSDLRGDKTRRRRMALGLVAGIAVLTGATWGTLHARTVRQARICRASAEAASAVWPFDAVRPGTIPPGKPTAMWQAFQRSGVADTEGIFARVSSTLSTYLGQWARQATDACEATHVRREQSREELALRMACFEDRLSDARALTDLLVRADAKVVAHAAEAVLGLGDLDRCSNLVLLRGVKTPEEAGKRAEVTSLRRRMGELKLLVGTGHFEAIAGEVDTLERDIRAASYPPLLAEFMLFRLSQMESGGAPAEHVSLVREALRVAERAGYEEGMAEALVALAWVEYRNPAIADLAFDQADSLLRHLGDPVVLRAWLENDLFVMSYANGQLAEALTHAERSLALKKQRTPNDDRDIGLSESNICLLLVAQGRAKEALPHCERGVELADAAVGRNHPSSMSNIENRASALVALERYEEACPQAGRVRAFFEERAEPIAGRPVLMVTLGLCAVHDGHPDVARVFLERGLAAATHAEAAAVEIADLEWPLARALYAAGENARGFEIADRAAKRYAALPELAFRAREIRAWLAAQRGR